MLCEFYGKIRRVTMENTFKLIDDRQRGHDMKRDKSWEVLPMQTLLCEWTKVSGLEYFSYTHTYIYIYIYIDSVISKNHKHHTLDGCSQLLYTFFEYLFVSC